MEVCQNEVENEHFAPALVLSKEGTSCLAFWVRIICGYGLDKKFDPIFVMENIIPRFDPSYNFVIVDTDCWPYEEFIPAFYSPMDNTIVIRGDTYDKALNGDLMEQINIAHEVSHCIQSIFLRFLHALKCVDFKTELCKIDSEQMTRHEEQTDALTSLLLSPNQVVAGKSEDEVFTEYIFNPVMTFCVGLIKRFGPKFLDKLKTLQLLEDANQNAS